MLPAVCRTNELVNKRRENHPMCDLRFGRGRRRGWVRRRGVWGRGGTGEEADELKAQEEPEAPADGPGALHSLGLPFSIWSETSPELSKSRPEAGWAPSWAGEGQQGRGGGGAVRGRCPPQPCMLCLWDRGLGPGPVPCGGRPPRGPERADKGGWSPHTGHPGRGSVWCR